MEAVSVPSNVYNFPVKKVPLFTGEGIQVKANAIIREDTKAAISVVSDQYEVFEHAKVLEKIEPFIKTFGDYEFRARTEKDGARALFSFTFKNNTIEVADRKVGDLIALRLTAINSYDSSTSLQFKVGGLRLVCDNGMIVNKGGFDLHFRHTKQISEIEMPDPEVVMSLFKDEGKLWSEYAERDVTPKAADDIVEQAFKLNIISKKAYNDSIVEFSRVNTFWDLFNAFTYAITHNSSRVQDSAKYNRLDRLNALFRHSTAKLEVKPTIQV